MGNSFLQLIFEKNLKSMHWEKTFWLFWVLWQEPVFVLKNIWKNTEVGDSKNAKSAIQRKLEIAHVKTYMSLYQYWYTGMILVFESVR